MASLGMSTATTEQAWRFDAKVANLLFATVEEAELVGCFELVALLLDGFLLCCGLRFAFLLLKLEVIEDRTKIALVKVLDFGATSLNKNKVSTWLDRRKSVGSQVDARQACP